jgi:hypothetical protein
MRLTLEEFIDSYRLPKDTVICHNPLDYTIWGSGVVYYMNHPIVWTPDGIVVFDKCKYCGSRDNATYKNLMEEDCCSHCNAPIRWENYE